MRAWLGDRPKLCHIDRSLNIHDGLLRKHSELNSSERTMKALLVTWLAELAASPLTTTQVLSSWNMVFTELPVTEFVDDVPPPPPPFSNRPHCCTFAACCSWSRFRVRGSLRVRGRGR